MARFDVYRLARDRQLVLDIQSDFFQHIKTRVVVPLSLSGERLQPATRLNPIFEIKGRRYILVTPSLAAVPTASLGAEITSLSNHHDEIVAALDMLFQGF